MISKKIAFIVSLTICLLMFALMIFHEHNVAYFVFFVLGPGIYVNLLRDPFEEHAVTTWRSFVVAMKWSLIYVILVHGILIRVLGIPEDAIFRPAFLAKLLNW